MNYTRAVVNSPAQDRKPLLIKIGPVIITLLALSSVSFLTLMLIDTAADGSGRASVGGAPISEGELVWRVTPLVVAATVVILTIAVGLYKERPWARPLAVWHQLAFISLMLIFIPPRIARAVVIQLIPNAILITGLAYLYFYRKRTVVQYYTNLALRMRPEPSTNSP